MKRVIISILAVCAAGIFSVSANAQILSGSQQNEKTQKPATLFTSDIATVQKGDNLFSLSVGVMNFNYMPPFVGLSYERVLFQFNENLCLGAGLMVGMTGVEEYYGYGVYALGNLHFSAVKNLDLFTGLDLGTVITEDGFGRGLYGSTVYPVHIGASYYFTNFLGATIRLGGWGGLSVGLTAKF